MTYYQGVRLWELSSMVESMHSRLNIPAPVGLKAEKDATRKLTMSSKDGA
jgi:hypothetical protein